MRIFRKIRLWSGLIIAVFLILHLSNHALGVISVQAMETMREFISPLWRSLPGTVVLYSAWSLHGFLALYVLYRKRTLRMPPWELTQLVLGFCIIPLLAVHAIGARGSWQENGLEVDYASVLQAIWAKDFNVGRQIVLLFVVWFHFAIGIHFWLRIRAWYPRWVVPLYSTSLLLPTLALLGFIRAARDVAAEQSDSVAAAQDEYDYGYDYSDSNYGEDPYATAVPQAVDLAVVQDWTIAVSIGLVVLVLLAREVRRFAGQNRERVFIRMADGREIRAPLGKTLLEYLRDARIPHPSVCGGRARCTTCRVRIANDSAAQHPPRVEEQAALTRIGAPPNVRLACQLRPQGHIGAMSLVSMHRAMGFARRPGGVSGEEKRVTFVFVDLRGSTALGETKLPYDVLFILNQFFKEMNEALNESAGFYAQFNGDGLMAMYGLNGDVRGGARQSLEGAKLMQRRLSQLNELMGPELSQPLRIGIGIHTGEAIVGTMGPPSNPIYTAIGDNVNVAARLEAKCKEYDCVLVVSDETIGAAEIDFSEMESREAELRGRQNRLKVYTVKDLEGIPDNPA